MELKYLILQSQHLENDMSKSYTPQAFAEWERPKIPLVPVESSHTRGQRLVNRMRGRATTTMSTDQLLQLLRGE